jgi:hypothetical protein
MSDGYLFVAVTKLEIISSQFRQNRLGFIHHVVDYFGDAFTVNQGEDAGCAMTRYQSFRVIGTPVHVLADVLADSTNRERLISACDFPPNSSCSDDWHGFPVNIARGASSSICTRVLFACASLARDESGAQPRRMRRVPA